MKFEAYSWWIAIILGFKIGGCGTIRDYNGFELGCSVLPKIFGSRWRRRITRKSRSLIL